MDLLQQRVQGDLASLKSPVRVLARFFRKSRDNWKGKYQRIKQEFKRLQVQVSDVRQSRETWKERAKASRVRADALEKEVVELKARLALQEQTVEKKSVLCGR